MHKPRNLKQRFSQSHPLFKAAIILGLIVALIALVYTFKAKAVVKNNQRSGELKPAVEVYKAERKDMLKTISLTGQTVPVSQVDIVAKYTGKITQVYVELGQKVVAGQELILQDTSDVNISLMQNGASLRQANADALETVANFEANYQKVQADYQRNVTSFQRYKTLYEQGAISKEALDNSEQQMINAKSALESWSKQINSGQSATVTSKQAASDKARSAIDALENQKKDLLLTAPRNGIISYRQAEVGGMAQAGQKLLTIVDSSSIYVDCTVSEQDVGQMSLGMSTVVSLDSLGKTFNGKIIYVSPAVDSKTQTFIARILLDNPDASIKTGMFARTSVSVLLRPQTLFIPREAILSLNGTERVFVIDAANKVTERVITTGLRNEKSVEVLSGLNENEQIAVTNLARLKTGVTVTPSNTAQ